MKKIFTLVVVCMLLAIGVIFSCRPGEAENVTFEKLFSNLRGYGNKEITIEGFYFQGFEINVLSERLEYSGLTEGHLVPKGRMVWVEGGLPQRGSMII